MTDHPVVHVTRAQIAAARLLVKRDQQAGRRTRAAVLAIAHARR